jgi:solute carrier family 25 (mitochondrial phosphate transporter), member 23/24/25/41
VPLAPTAASLGPIEAATAIVRKGGVGALFAGLGPATARVVPMAIISFGTYEWVRAQYTRMEEHTELEAARTEASALPTMALCATV